jgi:hypothetical protein
MKEFKSMEQRVALMDRERPIFEGWVRRVMAGSWPAEGGTYDTAGEFIGQYRDGNLNRMWGSWLSRAIKAELDEEAIRQAAYELGFTAASNLESSR